METVSLADFMDLDDVERSLTLAPALGRVPSPSEDAGLVAGASEEAIASARRALLTETLCGKPAEVTISTSGRSA